MEMAEKLEIILWFTYFGNRWLTPLAHIYITWFLNPLIHNFAPPHPLIQSKNSIPTTWFKSSNQCSVSPPRDFSSLVFYSSQVTHGSTALTDQPEDYQKYSDQSPACFPVASPEKSEF